MTTFSSARRASEILSDRRAEWKLDGDVGVWRRRNADAADVVRVVEPTDDLEAVIGRELLDELAHSSVADK
jgi:hypothetical protein